jgi:sugar phosphate isomerase/epimerase
VNLKLACADFTFPLLPHDRVLDLIAMLEFEAVDIGLFEGRSHLQPSQVFQHIGDSARELARKLGDRGLKAADIFLQTAPDFMSLAPNHPDPARRRQARQLFEQTLEFAAECGCRHVTALPGAHFEQESAADSFGRCCEELAWRCDRARQAGLQFGVEAHIGSIAPIPDLADELVDNTPGLTLTLDYTHFTERGIPDREIEPLLASASHFHARGACKGRLQAAVKDNVIDYARILEVMDETGYDGYVAIEYVWTEWQRCNEVDNLSETILLRDLLRNLHRSQKLSLPASDLS